MKDLIRRILPHKEAEPKAAKEQSAELYRHIQARQAIANLRLARLEIEANLLRRGEAGGRG